MNKVRTRHTVLMGDFDAKAGKKQSRDQALGEYGIGSRNARGMLLVVFAGRNNLRILKKPSTESERSRSGRGGILMANTKNEIVFILCIVQDVEVLGEIR